MPLILGNAFRGVVASEELDDMTKRTTTLQIIDGNFFATFYYEEQVQVMLLSKLKVSKLR